MIISIFGGFRHRPLTFCTSTLFDKYWLDLFLQGEMTNNGQILWLAILSRPMTGL